MHTIKLDHAKAFCARAANIKPNTLLPVLANIKIDFDGNNISFTKNNLRAFVTYTFKQEQAYPTKSVLIDEKIFSNFASMASNDLSIKQLAADKILITDGSTEFISPTEPPENFPLNDKFDADPLADEIKIDKETMQHLERAASFIVEEDIPRPTGHVFVGEGFIAGSDSFIAYKAPTKLNARIVMTPAALNGIKGFEELRFAENESYMYFYNADIMMGFVKSEHLWIDMYAKIMMPESDLFFGAKRAQMAAFNNACLLNSPNRTATVLASVNEYTMSLDFVDSEFNRECHTKQAVTKSETFLTGSLKYLPQNMNRILNMLPDEELYFYPAANGRMYFITDKTHSFTSLLMLIL